MSPTAPIIDDRSYEALLDEVLRRIPVHEPEWTDFNQSDPGITLLELLAFLAETVLWLLDERERQRRRRRARRLAAVVAGAAAVGVVVWWRPRDTRA